MLDNILKRHKPDILDCIANLSSDEVFTPPAVANNMLDLLPPEVWKDPTLRWLDPGCKSGVFLREVAKRLMVGLEEAIPHELNRREHIFLHMLHGIAITELTAQISRRTLYYSKDATSKNSVVQMPTPDGNIRYKNIAHTYKSGSCIHCGAPESASVGRDLGAVESHAYLFIHEDFRVDCKMNFDVIVGNPPYQLKDGGHGASASPLYHKFVIQALEAKPSYVSMIVPSRWFAGGKGLDEFRQAMLGDNQLRVLVDHPDASECFPGVDIAGGVCYFLWVKGSTGDCRVVTRQAGEELEAQRVLNEFPTFIRDARAVSIVKKILATSEPRMSDVVSSRKPFGLATTARPESAGDLTLIWNGGQGPYPFESLKSGQALVRKWKVLSSYVSYDHGGQPGRDGKRRVLSKLILAQPHEICTETYLVMGAFDSKGQAENLECYLKTRFVRFLVSLLALTQHITKDKFSFVPMLQMDTRWDDAKLYARYGISPEEVAYIESMIKEMP